MDLPIYQTVSEPQRSQSEEERRSQKDVPRVGRVA
jgi:hypothetical protein